MTITPDMAAAVAALMKAFQPDGRTSSEVLRDAVRMSDGGNANPRQDEQRTTKLQLRTLPVVDLTAYRKARA